MSACESQSAASTSTAAQSAIGELAAGRHYSHASLAAGAGGALRDATDRDVLRKRLGMHGEVGPLHLAQTMCRACRFSTAHAQADSRCVQLPQTLQSRRCKPCRPCMPQS